MVTNIEEQNCFFALVHLINSMVAKSKVTVFTFLCSSAVHFPKTVPATQPIKQLVRTLVSIKALTIAFEAGPIIVLISCPHFFLAKYI